MTPTPHGAHGPDEPVHNEHIYDELWAEFAARRDAEAPTAETPADEPIGCEATAGPADEVAAPLNEGTSE